LRDFDQDTVIALGSNQSFNGLGPADLLRLVLQDLEQKGVEIVACSRFFRTPCFPAGAGPDYVNAAAVVQTDMSPAELLAVLHQVEAGLGRERHVRWAARTVDIDLLTFGQRVLPDVDAFMTWHDLPMERQQQEAPAQLILPHPRLHERAFVLVPMMDVSAGWTHPVLNQTVQDMCENLPATDLDEVKPI